jgi:hypothetical protein
LTLALAPASRFNRSPLVPAGCVALLEVKRIQQKKEMAAQAEGRILKELAEVSKDDTSGVSASVVPGTGGNRHLLGRIKGPEGTVYDGGVFEIDIVIPQPYPFEPPKMKFMTKIWHPNISSQTGVSASVDCCVYPSVCLK